MDTIKIMKMTEKEARFDMALAIGQQERAIGELRAKNTSLTKRVERALQQANELHQLHDGKLLDKARKDSKAIHDMYHLAYLKQNVAEMVVWACKNAPEYKDLAPLVGLKIIELMAMDDKWWLRHEDILLKEWIELIVTGDIADKMRVKKK